MIENAIQLDASVRRIRDALDAAGWRGGIVVAVPAELADDAALIAQELSLAAVELATAGGADTMAKVAQLASRPCLGSGFVVTDADGVLAAAAPAERRSFIEMVLALDTPHAVVVPAVLASGELPRGARRVVRIDLPQLPPSQGLYDISLI